ncbi:hypothetical protein AF960_03047 [Listeria monocytogenes]|nr:hypothetical protein AF960_03047 [Listeria monocytogenes]
MPISIMITPAIIAAEFTEIKNREVVIMTAETIAGMGPP